MGSCLNHAWLRQELAIFIFILGLVGPSMLSSTPGPTLVMSHFDACWQEARIGFFEYYHAQAGRIRLYQINFKWLGNLSHQDSGACFAWIQGS